jgi:hypothetical protein
MDHVSQLEAQERRREAVTHLDGLLDGVESILGVETTPANEWIHQTLESFHMYGMHWQLDLLETLP